MFSKIIAASAILTGADALRFDLENLFGPRNDDDDDENNDNAVFSQLVDSIEGQLVDVGEKILFSHSILRNHKLFFKKRKTRCKN